jgi:hypothetical protein
MKRNKARITPKRHLYWEHEPETHAAPAIDVTDDCRYKPIPKGHKGDTRER